MRIIIAMDIIGGKCVRLTKGDYSTTRIYSTDPLDFARQAEDHGIKYLHIVDLDGAREKKIINSRILKEISSTTP
jgi:phosphoribosylformimino-5-aminoimidazole carboxamide ribotide isomerase